MKKGQRTLPFSDSGQLLSVSQQLPQYIRQDTAVTEVIDLDWRIDTQKQGNAGRTAVGTVNEQCGVLQGPDIVQSEQIESFIAAQSQRCGTVIAGELEWQNRHADQIGAMNPFKRAGDDGFDT